MRKNLSSLREAITVENTADIGPVTGPIKGT